MRIFFSLVWLKTRATFNNRGSKITYRNIWSSILPELSEPIADSSQMVMSASAPGGASTGRPLEPKKRKLAFPSSYEVDDDIVAVNWKLKLGEVEPINHVLLWTFPQFRHWLPIIFLWRFRTNFIRFLLKRYFCFIHSSSTSFWRLFSPEHVFFLFQKRGCAFFQFFITPNESARFCLFQNRT